MRNPLTSKERRGLTAVAAAALLCIGLGFIARNCSSISKNNSTQIVIVNDSIDSSMKSDKSYSIKKSDNSRRFKNYRKKKESGNKKKAEKSYPLRDPLSQPCD